jgi:hypothetical protein
MDYRLCCAAILLACWPAIGSAAAPDIQAVKARGLFRGQPVTFTEAHGKRIFQGDILLDKVVALPPGHGTLQPSVGVAYTQYLWPAGSQGYAEIPYIVTSGATALNTALTTFNATFSGVIQFVPYTNQPDYVNFDFDPNNFSGQCESYVGRVGGEQNVGGSVSCDLGTILHEMGHVVGLYHEMSRPDRDTYITINTGNLIKGSESNFDKLGDDFQDLTLFDYASVMEYIPYAFTRNGGVVAESIPPGIALSSLTGYSASDVDGIERLYGAAPKAVTVTSNPQGLSVIVDGATVTTPQTFAWRLHSTHTLDIPTNAQSIGGGTYTYGRWNDNTAASHSVTVTPGNNTLAAPATSPAVTVYSANFVQLSPYTATYDANQGSFTVNPAPQSYPGVSGTYFVARQPVTLTAAPANGYQFVTWGGTSLPLSANPKTDLVPDGAAAYSVSATFTNQPVFTITTNPAGLYFQIDGTYYYQGPQSFDQAHFNWVPGQTHTVTGFSPNQPYSVNTRYVFKAWSDKGALSHTITVPKISKTLTGTWTPQYVPIAYATPDCAAAVTLTPSSPDGFYTTGTKVKVAAVPETGWLLTGWSGDLTGRRATQILTVNDEELAISTYDTTATALSLATLSPDIFPAGSAGGTVKIHGTGFTANSILFVNNSYRFATFVSSREIDVALAQGDVTTAGAFPIGVSNFPSGAPCSAYAALTFFVAQ